MFSASLATMRFYFILDFAFFSVLARIARQFHLPIGVDVFLVFVSDLSDYTQQLWTLCVSGQVELLFFVLWDHVLYSVPLPNSKLPCFGHAYVTIFLAWIFCSLLCESKKINWLVNWMILMACQLVWVYFIVWRVVFSVVSSKFWILIYGIKNT